MRVLLYQHQHDAGATMSGLIAYCRQGFEPELAAELRDRAVLLGIAGDIYAQRNHGFVLLRCDPLHVDTLLQQLHWRRLIFARQTLRLHAELKTLNSRDRIAPILAALPKTPCFGDLWIEYPDSDMGKPLAGLARSFGNALRPVLRSAGRLSAQLHPQWPRLHVCFLSGDHVLLGSTRSVDSAPWQLGIPRLKLLPEAPSRSALKLEEALITLLTPNEREAKLRPGMQATDLGAAPGGWTWVLIRQHLRVTSIDNAALRPPLLNHPLVQHVRADGFRWTPPRPMDWMVCDMVEQPRRVAERMAVWLREGWCRHMIFNLKLPMKKRWDETRLCLERFETQAAVPLTLRAKQLYHDREEITVYASNDAR
ncbi:putative RNA 2'-O-ribose methyltransferase [Xylella fastidiosa]|nr:23S rRNA methyltransferase [Xylella fastidiosa subsp. multiplex Griffin-1]KFA40551.1 putative RNA 2'-O-ribose methyltransferase [Xylella fastidiosa]MDS9988870.1 23S rRNA methyltransferase [Xylella fastidiosa]